MPINTLADPQDAGNKPGDGPLRPGGQGASTATAEKDRPDTLSSAAKRQQGALSIVRDLWGGTDAVRARTTTYLPKAPGEDTRVYANRLARSVFHNFFRRNVEGLTGLVFRKDPVLSDDVPQQIRDHWENIDMAGTHGDVFARQQLQDALAAGHNAILVEFPKTDGKQTAADEDKGPIRPYWVPIHKDNLLSWRTTVEDGATKLTQLVVKEVTTVPDGDFGESEQTRYRVFYRDAGVVGFRLLEVTKERTVVEHAAGTYPTQNEIPVAEVVTSGHVGLFESDPPLISLAHLNIAHYQQWSDYADTLHKIVPFLFTAGVVLETETGEPLVVGPNSSIASPDPNAKAEYVAHSGGGISDQKESLEELKADMGALGLSMIQKRVGEKVEAKRMDREVTDSALAVTARGLQDAVERCFGFHARYLKLPDGGSIQVNRDYEALLMEAPVMQAFAQLVKVGFPEMAVLKALQKGGRIAEDEDLEALALEWMVGAVAEGAIADMERSVENEDRDLDTEAR